MSLRAYASMAAVVAIIALLGFGVLRPEPTLAVGDAAPDRPLPMLEGEGSLALADFRGSWVLVNFWASWCPPCKSESPDIQGFLEEHEDEEFVVFGIDSRDSTEAGLEFVREEGLTWEMVRDGDGERMDAYGIRGLPETFLVDPEGEIAAICRGPLNREQLDAVVIPFLRAGTGSSEAIPPFCRT
jgi:cytochrome c biogenesis protein CcmG, thiol:disulfide interchange protein DsbE